MKEASYLFRLRETSRNYPFACIILADSSKTIPANVASSTASSLSCFSSWRILLMEVVPSSRSFLFAGSVVDTVTAGILLLFLLTPTSFVWPLDVFLSGSTRLIASIVLAKRLWSFWFIRNSVATHDRMISTITVPIVYLMILGRGLPEVCVNPPDENWSVCGSIVYCKLASPFRTVLYIIIQPVERDFIKNTYRNRPEIHTFPSLILLTVGLFLFLRARAIQRWFLRCRLVLLWSRTTGWINRPCMTYKLHLYFVRDILKRISSRALCIIAKSRYHSIRRHDIGFSSFSENVRCKISRCIKRHLSGIYFALKLPAVIIVDNLDLVDNLLISITRNSLIYFYVVCA